MTDQTPIHNGRRIVRGSMFPPRQPRPYRQHWIADLLAIIGGILLIAGALVAAAWIVGVL